MRHFIISSRGNNDEESVVQELKALIASIGRIHNHAVLEAFWHASTILTSLSLKGRGGFFQKYHRSSLKHELFGEAFRWLVVLEKYYNFSGPN